MSLELQEANNKNFISNLKSLDKNIDISRVKTVNLDYLNIEELKILLNDTNPMLFNLTGPSSVYNSINDSGYTNSTMLSIFDNITNSLIESNKYIPFYQAKFRNVWSSKKSKI